MPTLRINGRLMHYLDEGKGFPLLLGHSFLWNANMWRPQIDILTSQYRCIVPDLWSHGQSENLPHAPYRIPNLAHDYWALMQALDLSEFGVIGLSIGGMWGMQMALHYPEAVKAVAIIGSYVGEEPEKQHQQFNALLDTAEQFFQIPSSLQQAILPYFFSDKALNSRPEIVQPFKSLLSSYTHEQIPGLVNIGRGVFSRTSLLDRLVDLETPTLILVGEEDRSRPPSHAKKMANHMDGAELHIIPKTGHIANLESPDIVNQHLLTFLRKTLKPQIVSTQTSSNKKRFRVLA